jgi:hypothetical protein
MLAAYPPRVGQQKKEVNVMDLGGKSASAGVF